MDLKSVSSKIQSGFEWLSESLRPIEHRWFVFLLSCGLIILFKAAGATGLALLFALFYIMYFVTLKQ